MKSGIGIISLCALSILPFCCHKGAVPEIIASPGKTRAPIEIRVANLTRERGRARFEILVTPAETMARGKFVLRLQGHEKRPHSEPEQYLRDIVAGTTASLPYDLPILALQNGNPVLDAETEIAGLPYKSSHEIVINPTMENKNADRKDRHERKIKELR